MLLNAHTISWNIWQLSCAHRNSRNILRGPVQICWVCLKHQTKSIIPRLSKSYSQVLGTLRTRTMPQVCQSILHWPFSIRQYKTCLTLFDTQRWHVAGWNEDGHRFQSSRCIWPLRSKCPAAKALAKRMASGGVTREPAPLKTIKTIKTCKRHQKATRCKRCAKDVQNATRSLLPYRSVHRCGGPTWPYALNDSKISILDEQDQLVKNCQMWT